MRRLLAGYFGQATVASATASGTPAAGMRRNRPTPKARGISLWTCAALLSFVATTAEAADDAAHKYRMLSPGLHWSGNVVTWAYAPAGQPTWTDSAQMVTLVTQAMSLWSAQCGVQFSYVGTTANLATVEDGASIIGWLPHMNSGANTSWYFRNGAMTEADIQLNVSANGSAAAAFPLVLHEIGHAIGLDHSEVRDAVMAGPPAAPTYSYATTLHPDDIVGCQALYGPPQSAAAPSPQTVAKSTLAASDARALEYYHAGLDHYFMSADPAEQAALATGGADGGWHATGISFPVWKLAYPGMQPMCRFYGDWHIDPATGRRKGPDSHFYTADPYECGSVAQRWPVWLFEGHTFFVSVPDSLGSCPVGSQPVYRYFRPQGDPNHRFVTTEAGKQEMGARGWLPEGITWCAGA